MSAVRVFDDPATDEAAVLSWASGSRYQDEWSYVENLGRILRSIEPGDKRDHIGAACLFHGRVDDPRVTADLLHVVSALPEDPSNWTHSAVRGALALQTDPAAVEEYERFRMANPDPRGIFQPTKPVVPQFPDTKTRERLAQIGIHKAKSVDAEAGRSPPPHDRLLTELAMVGPSVLEDAVFLQEGEASLALTAWVGGKRWDSTGKATGDWYDLKVVVALLNTMSRDLGSDDRYLLIGEPGSMAVLIAPEPALAAAVVEGLVQPIWDGRS